MRYPYDIDGFYTWNPIDTDVVLPNTTSVNPVGIIKPKIVNTSDPDSSWIMGLTPEEVITYLEDVRQIRNALLAETSIQATANVRERIPLTETESNLRKAAETFYTTEILRVDPNFVFPDKTKVPAMELTYRQTVVTAGTSIVMDYYIDTDVLREVKVSGTELESFTWNKSTQTLSDIVVFVGDKLKIKY